MPSATFTTYGGNEKEIIRRGVGAIGKKRSLLLEAHGIDLTQEQCCHRKRLSKISAVSSDIRRVAVRLVERTFPFLSSRSSFSLLLGYPIRNSGTHSSGTRRGRMEVPSSPQTAHWEQQLNGS